MLTFDLRNHGTSEAQPNLTMMPWVAPNVLTDLRAAIDYLMSRPDADPRARGRVWGCSRAAGAALCLAADDARIRCLFTDGAYPTHTTQLIFLRRYIDIYIPYPWTYLTRNLPDWFYHIFLGTARSRWGRRTGFHFVNVEQQAARVKVPVMMVHGEKDRMIPVAAARALRKCITSPAKLMVVAGRNTTGRCSPIRRIICGECGVSLTCILRTAFARIAAEAAIGRRAVRNRAEALPGAAAGI